MFDPYSQWLGISKERRPINCYMLLGISPKVTDPDEIAAAASARSATVSEHVDGPHAQAATRLLKEIGQAKTVLCDPARRRDYDAKLRQGAATAPAAKPKSSTTVTPVVAEAVEVEDEAKVQDKSKKAEPGRKKKRPKKEEKKGAPIGLIVLGVGVVVVLLGVGGAVGAYFAFGTSPAPASTPMASQPQVTMPERPTPPIETKPTVSEPKKEDPPKPAPPPKKPEPPKPAPPKRPAPKPPVIVRKLPAPDAAAQAKAEAVLKEEYKADYAKVKPEEKLLLAAKFLQPGREDRLNPAGWFVMLREARDLAVQANKPRLAIEAVDEINSWFSIDPLEMKSKVLADFSAAGNDLANVALRYRVTLNIVQQAYDQENFAAAKKFLDQIEATIREIKANDLYALLFDQKKDYEEYQRNFDAFTIARNTLTQRPDDPESLATAGKYLCFFQGKWDEGLPMLAQGTDPELKALAAKDLAEPTEVKDQLGVAEGWWAASVKARERSKRNLIIRAKSWYERVGPATTGDDRAQVIKRIMEAQKIEYARIKKLQPGSYFGRDTENRTLQLRHGGGSMQSEEAIERGLEWLAKHQSSNGSWSMDGFHRIASCKCGDPGEKHDVAATAFGLMPFLGVGDTHRSGRHRALVERGLTYLLSQQKPAGNLHDNAYENALASIVVIEAYGLTRDVRLRLPAQAATNYIVQAQHEGGSWGYSARAKGDTSVCGWQFTALKAAVFAGLTVPNETFDRLSLFQDSVADSNGNGYGYNTPGAGVSTSAVGILCREFLSWGPGHPGLDKGAEFLLRPENIPARGKISMYSAFYITQVAHHLGGRHWEKWNDSVRDLLVDLQDKGDNVENPKLQHQKGSWSPYGDPWAKQGGRLMFTSLALVTLESYYYHIPLYGYRLELLMD